MKNEIDFGVTLNFLSVFCLKSNDSTMYTHMYVILIYTFSNNISSLVEKKFWDRNCLGAAKVLGQQRSHGSKLLGAAKVSRQQRSQGSKGLGAAKVSGQQRSQGSKALRATKVQGSKGLGAAKVSGQKRSQGSKGLRAEKVSGQQMSFCLRANSG